jgi:hypothetical protein
MPPIISLTAALPRGVPENRFAPGWCHTMSSANIAPTVAKSFADNASK